VSRPHAGWSEQNADDWWTATERVLDACPRSHGKAMGAVRGIGLSGHMHGATLIDRSRQAAPALHPVERRTLGRRSR
jgi:xylulokinase